jgi:uncharacterized membrane protein
MAPAGAAAAGLARTAGTSVQRAPIATGVHTAVLPGLDGPNFVVAGINDWAEVVGSKVLPPLQGVPITRAFHWQLTRGLVVLDVPGIVTSGAAGVNNLGQVAVAINTDTSGHAGIWSWDGSLRVLRLLSTYSQPSIGGLPYCTATGINNHGEVAGNCWVVNVVEDVPTVWTPSGRPDGFGGPNGAGHGDRLFGLAGGLSDAGFIAGIVDLGVNTPLGFVISPSADVVMLPGGSALAVNDSGWAVGRTLSSSPTPPPCLRALAWLRGFALQDLGTCGQANGITDDGVIVGTATDSAGHAPYAFVWTAADGLRRLPGLDAKGTDETSSAVAINRQHQIVGSITSQGAQHVVMWTLPADTSAAHVLAEAPEIRAP